LIISLVTIDAFPKNTALVLRRVARDATTSGGVFSGITAEDQVNSHWEDFILPSPMIITLLGQLMVVSTKVDFSLAEFAPQKGFKYMRHPESFRASLVKVSNDGWQAFMTAHTNMDQIQLYMAQIPVQMKTSLKLIANGSPTLIGQLLPVSLNEVERISNVCVEKSAETAKAFDAVMRLLGELLESTSSSQGVYQSRLTEVNAQLNATAEQKSFLEDSAESIRKKEKELDDQVIKYRSAYDKALGDIPTGFKVVLLEGAKALVNTINALPALFGAKDRSSTGGSSSSTDPAGDKVASFEKTRVFAFVPKLFDQFRKFKNDFNDLLSENHNGSSSKIGKPSDMFKAYAETVKYFDTLLQTDTPDRITGELSAFIKEAEQIYRNFAEIYQKYPSPSIDQESAACMTKFEDLKNRMQPLVEQSQKTQDGFAMVQAGPTRQVMGDSGRYEGTGGNERYIADSTLQRLRDAEARDDYYFAELEKNQKELGEIVGRMATLNMQEINYEKILELIAEGIKRLGQISENWTNLVMFFQAVADRARILVKGPLDIFLAEAKVRVTDEDRQYFVETLTEQAQSINAGAYFLYTVSSTYVDVSGRFLMQRLAGLAKLLATTDEAERTNLLLDLQTQANVAQAAIKEMSQKKRDEYKQLVNARKIELDDVLKKLGSPSSVLMIK